MNSSVLVYNTVSLHLFIVTRQFRPNNLEKSLGRGWTGKSGVGKCQAESRVYSDTGSDRGVVEAASGCLILPHVIKDSLSDSWSLTEWCWGRLQGGEGSLEHCSLHYPLINNIQRSSWRRKMVLLIHGVMAFIRENEKLSGWRWASMECVERSYKWSEGEVRMEVHWKNIFKHTLSGLSISFKKMRRKLSLYWRNGSRDFRFLILRT